MIAFKNTIVINRPIEEVFAFVSNFENLPKWNYFVTQAVKESDGPIGEGTTFHITRKTDEQRLRVQNLEPNKQLTLATTSSSQSLVMFFEFEPLSEKRTRLVDEWKLSPDIPSPFAWLAARKVKSAVLANLRKLKTLLETGQVTLQDGRNVTYRKPEPQASN